MAPTWCPTTGFIFSGRPVAYCHHPSTLFPPPVSQTCSFMSPQPLQSDPWQYFGVVRSCCCSHSICWYCTIPYRGEPRGGSASSHCMTLNQGGLRSNCASTRQSWRGGGGCAGYSRFERRQISVSCHFDEGGHQDLSDLRGQRHDSTFFITSDELCCCCVVCVFRCAQACGVWRAPRKGYTPLRVGRLARSVLRCLICLSFFSAGLF